MHFYFGLIHSRYWSSSRPFWRRDHFDADAFLRWGRYVVLALSNRIVASIHNWRMSYICGAVRLLFCKAFLKWIVDLHMCWSCQRRTMLICSMSAFLINGSGFIDKFQHILHVFITTDLCFCFG